MIDRAERMAEKLVFNWLVITMYGEVAKPPISRALYELFSAVKHITENGPVDSATGRSYYTLNLDNMIEKQLDCNDDKMVAVISSVFALRLECW